MKFAWRFKELEAQRVLHLFINSLNLLEVAGILINSQGFVHYAEVGCVTHQTLQQHYVLDIWEDLFNTKQFFCLMLYNRTAEHLPIILATITVTRLSISNDWSISQICWYFSTWTVLFFIGYCLVGGFLEGLLFFKTNKKIAVQRFAIGSLLFLEETPSKQTIS